MALQRNQKDETFDYLLRLKDAGLVAASAAAQVGGADKILDMGAQRFDGRAVLDLSAVEVGTGDEDFRIIVQGSTSATFATDVWNLGAALLGDSSKSFETVDSVIGRREIAFCNEINGTVYRYLRVYTFVAGTIATGINYTAFLVKKA
jgi:hypothetical protein